MEVFSMGRRFTVVAVTLLLGSSAAWAQSSAPKSDPDSPYTDTVYATDQHMGYSIRTTIVQWLGGVNVSRERDNKASQKEGWWGEPAAEISPDLAKSLNSDR
jgi:hypothetical protein